ncbi:MAG TPA: TrkH family potassium uptake protein [Clostridiaceae bacterium]|nr:TrkH family potassium uptake protein [Clostridiaceae bacterium]
MNYRSLSYTLGRILKICSLLFLPPVAVALIYREPPVSVLAFLSTGILTFVIGVLLMGKKPERLRFSMREGLVLTFSLWGLLSLLGALPFMITGDIPHLVDAVFETASGLTTTGSTILDNIENMRQSCLFWRSFTHLIGGMGVLVLVFAIMPTGSSESMPIMKAEVPGHEFGKLVARMKNNSLILYGMYLGMTAVLVIFLLLGGMPLFDSLVTAFGTAGTGGFGIKSASIAYYQSPYIDMVISIFMILFGINFAVYYFFLIRQPKKALFFEELRWFLAIIGAAFLAITLIVKPLYDSWGETLRHVFFTVSSSITTTGYVIVDYGSWPIVTHVILLLIMSIGSCAGSTGGGFKISRLAILIKNMAAEIKKTRDPRRMVAVSLDHKNIEHQERHVLRYLGIYIACFMGFVLILSFDVGDLETAISGVVATMNNIGPALGSLGPIEHFGGLSDLSKVTLSFAMIGGRLELLPMLVFFSPRTWRRLA